MNLQQIRNNVEQLKGKQSHLQNEQRIISDHITELKVSIVDTEDARAVIQVVAEETQRQLEYHISEIATLALSSVFDNPYKLSLEFVQRRNKIEADLWFVRDDEKVSPLEASGGGAVDVAAIALRVAMWSLQRPRTRNVLILDEPLRFLSRDLMSKASQMLSEVSKRLNLQIIMVTHSPELIEGADKFFEVKMKEGVSYVTEGNKEPEPQHRSRRGN